jgi:hypothetical protein
MYEKYTISTALSMSLSSHSPFPRRGRRGVTVNFEVDDPGLALVS